MLNASVFQEEWLMNVADVVEVFEGDVDKYEQRYRVQPWLGYDASGNEKYPSDRSYQLIHTCPEERVEQVVQRSGKQNVSCVYVYHKDSNYNELPPYWTDLTARLWRWNKF